MNEAELIKQKNIGELLVKAIKLVDKLAINRFDEINVEWEKFIDKRDVFYIDDIKKLIKQANELRADPWWDILKK